MVTDMNLNMKNEGGLDSNRVEDMVKEYFAKADEASRSRRF